MNQFKILVVEDDRSVRNLISTTLNVNDYRCVMATSCREAIAMTLSQTPDIVLLDLGLPDMDGVEYIRKVREWSKVPIIIISARAEASDKIEALDAGADDYITKPFSTDEMLARIRASQRRLSYYARQTPEDPVFRCRNLSVNYENAEVKVNDVLVHLTRNEYRLLKLMTKHVDKVLTHSYITKKIWGEDDDSNRLSLRVYMASLRKKLSQAGCDDMIQTQVGIGYRFCRNPEG